MLKKFLGTLRSAWISGLNKAMEITAMLEEPPGTVKAEYLTHLGPSAE